MAILYLFADFFFLSEVTSSLHIHQGFIKLLLGASICVYSVSARINKTVGLLTLRDDIPVVALLYLFYHLLPSFYYFYFFEMESPFAAQARVP